MMRSGEKPVFFAMYRHVNLQYGLRCRASSGRRSSNSCRLLGNTHHSEVHFFRVVVRVESLCNAQDGILQKENDGCGKPPRPGACPSSNDELIAAHVKSRQSHVCTLRSSDTREQARTQRDFSCTFDATGTSLNRDWATPDVLKAAAWLLQGPRRRRAAAPRCNMVLGILKRLCNETLYVSCQLRESANPCHVFLAGPASPSFLLRSRTRHPQGVVRCTGACLLRASWMVAYSLCTYYR